MNYRPWRDVVLNKMEFIAYLFRNKGKLRLNSFSNQEVILKAIANL